MTFELSSPMPPGGPSPTDDRQLYQFIYGQLSLGKKDPDIVDLLVARGVQTDKAVSMVQNARAQRNTAIHGRGKKRVRNGLIAIAIGAIITVGTLLAAASGATGGTYFISYGPVIIGLYWLALGLSDLSKK